MGAGRQKDTRQIIEVKIFSGYMFSVIVFFVLTWW